MSDSTGEQDAAADGEMLEMTERVIVSPVDGVFFPDGMASDVRQGDVIGHVMVAGRERVPVTSPFAGHRLEMVAWHGERVQTAQRIAWLRAA